MSKHLHAANHNDLKGVIMADHDIQKSQHLLKRLNEEIIFLSSLMAQAQIVSSNLQGTWIAIDQLYRSWKRDIES